MKKEIKEKIIEDWEKEFGGDELAKLYKEFEKKIDQEGMSSMEICNSDENCNIYVSKKLIEKIRQLLSQEKQKWIKDLKTGKICLNCGGKKEGKLTDLCDKCLEEN